MPLQDLSPQDNPETITPKAAIIQIPMNDTNLTVKFVALNVFQFSKQTS